MFRRFGTDAEGRSFDERVVIKDVVLAEIDRADVALMGYNDGNAELF